MKGADEMAVLRDDSQQTTANINVVDGDGNRKSVASATCHIRPNKGMTISVDVQDEAATNAANFTDVSETIAAYLAEEITKAAALGVPIALPGGGTRLDPALKAENSCSRKASLIKKAFKALWSV